METSIVSSFSSKVYKTNGKLRKKKVTIGSLIEMLDKYIEVGNAFGYEINGCKEDI